MKSEGGLGWSEGEVGMYDARVCVAAKVKMIPIPILSTSGSSVHACLHTRAMEHSI